MKGKVTHTTRSITAMILLLLSFCCSAQSTLYTLKYVNPGSRMLCEVDPVTGNHIPYPASTSPGFLNNSFTPAIDPTGNRFFMPMSQQLFTFDLATGNVLNSPWLTSPFALPAYNCLDSTLYGISETGNSCSFVSIDPVTGAFTVIAPNICQSYSAIASCAIDMPGRRYFFTGTDQNGQLHLFTIDLSTGAVLNSPVLATPFDCLTYSCRDNTIYGMRHQNGLLFSSIDNVTGLVTAISTTPITGGVYFSSPALDAMNGIYYILVPELFAPITHLVSIDVTNGNVINNVTVDPMIGCLAIKTPCSPDATFTSTASCSGQPMSFFANPLAINNYWNFGDPASGSNNTSTLQSPTHTFTSPGIYNVMHVSSSCTGNDTSIQQVTVTAPSFPPVVLGNDTVICNSNNLVLNGNYPATFQYLWQNGSTQPSLTATASGTYWIQVTDGTCTASDTISIVFDAVSATVTGPSSICEGSNAILLAGGGGPYVWSTGEAGSEISVSPAASQWYYLSVTNICGTATDSLMITVNPLPAANAGVDTAVFSGSSVQLNASGGTSYAWDPPVSLSCYNCPSPVASPTETTTYIVTVTNAYGCTSQDTITVTVEKETSIFIPNAFSPNGDGQNDLLFVMGKGIKDTRLMIFDRWGEMVFLSTGLNNGWDGTYKGQPLNSAVFTYYLEVTLYTGERVVKQGNISLVR